MADRDTLSPEEADLLDIDQIAPEERAEIEKQRALEKNFRHEFMLAQMQNREFRAWLMQKLTEMGTFVNAFGHGRSGFPDPNASWFAAGRKSAGWDLWEEVDAIAPDWASLMRREAALVKEEARAIAPPAPPSESAIVGD